MNLEQKHRGTNTAGVESSHGNAYKEGSEVPATGYPCFLSFPGLNFSSSPFYSLIHPTNIGEQTVYAGHCPRFWSTNKDDNVPAFME